MGKSKFAKGFQQEIDEESFSSESEESGEEDEKQAGYNHILNFRKDI